MHARTYVYDILLLAVTFFWGSTFILVKRAVEVTGVFPFLGVRFLLAAVILGLGLGRRWKRLDRRTLARGTVLGIALFLSYAFQTVGLSMTSASNAGFITGLSVVMVPLMSAVVYRIYPRPRVAAGVAMATIGLWLMTGAGSGGSVAGDLLVLVCAVCVAIHILLTGRFVESSDPYLLAGVQLGAVAILALLAMAVLPGGRLSAQPVVLWAWGITVLFATIFAFVVQTAAQRVVSPTGTALIFTMEPVFAALFALLFGGEVLTAAGWAGGALIFAGMVVTEASPFEWSGFGRRKAGGTSEV